MAAKKSAPRAKTGKSTNDLVKLTMWYIDTVGGLERAKTLILAVADLDDKIGEKEQQPPLFE